MRNEILFWTPQDSDLEAMETELGRAFWEAFSSPPHWNGLHPMELGKSHEEAFTARWFVRRFINAKMKIILASGFVPEKDFQQFPILGFAFGGVLNEDLLSWFQLARFGAQVGDGILPFAGIVPLAHGYRIDEAEMCVIRDSSGLPVRDRSKGKSLYRMLFEKRLELPELQSCPRTYLRTRQVLEPVIAMAQQHGFNYLGSFYTVWQNRETQDRLVYCLDRT